MRTSSYAPNRKRQITAKFTGQCRTVGPQNGSRFTSTFSCRESVTFTFLKNLLGPWHNPDLWGFDNVSDIWDPSCFALRPSSITSYVTRTLHLGNRLCFRLQVQTCLVDTLGRTNFSQCDWDCGQLQGIHLTYWRLGMKSEPASEEYCYVAEGGENLKKEKCFWKHGLYIGLYMFIYHKPRQFPFTFFIHPSFMCCCPSQIFKLRYNFKLHNSYLYVAILSCFLITRHE
jgi:hypothetical protein